MFYVYLLTCVDGSYYCGQTDNIDARMTQHWAGEIGYTSTRKPVELVWQGEFESREGAITFEQQIKGWSRAKKEALIKGDWDEIKSLAKSKNQVQKERLTAPENPSTSSGGTVGSTEGAVEKLLSTFNQTEQRRAIAKAITLLESTRHDHREQADVLLTSLLPHTGNALRLGISGVPGVGKSTFIEALGLFLIEKGHRVAVLTIDPSSSVSGGSILGDKTRMEKLSVHEKAYIRPSPSSGTLGGVASMTREAMLVCEAAGYDIVIVETVGVGQSETAVQCMTDMFVLMQLPNAGDDLQAIKKGVMELADLVVINKADIDPDAATRAQALITSSLRLLGQHGRAEHAHYDETIWHPQVMQLSALQGTGLDAFWSAVSQFKDLQVKNGKLAQRRQSQSLAWMWDRITAGLQQSFKQNLQVQSALPGLTQQVLAGSVVASTAARQLLNMALDQ